MDDVTEAKTGFKTETTSGKTSNEVVALGDGTYAYTDDVKVFFVDDDEITEGDVSDIREDNDNDEKASSKKDPYANIYFTLNDDGEVEMIVLEKN